MSERGKLQKRAKELGIKATGTNESLRKAIEKATQNKKSTKRAKRTSEPKKSATKEKKPERTINEIREDYTDKINIVERENADLVRQYENYQKEINDLKMALQYSKKEYFKDRFKAIVPPPNEYINGDEFRNLKNNPYIELKKIGTIEDDVPKDYDTLPEDMFDWNKVKLAKGVKLRPENQEGFVHLMAEAGFGEHDYVTRETIKLINIMKENAHNDKFSYDVYEIRVKPL